MKLNDNIEVLNNDCLLEFDNIKDKSIDMILCDLPYGVLNTEWDKQIPLNDYVIHEDKLYHENDWILYNYKNINKPYNYKNINKPYNYVKDEFNEKCEKGLWTHYDRIIKENGCIALFSTEPFTTILKQSNIKFYKYDWIWKKSKPTGFLNANERPLLEYETISIFYKRLPTYNPQKKFVGIKDFRKTFKSIKGNESFVNNGLEVKAKEDDGTRFPTSILEFNNSDKTNLIHETQKPTELLKYLIKTYTNENELVLDNTMGSGSTGVACIETNRKFIGIEIDTPMFHKAKNRLELSIMKDVSLFE